MNIIGDVEGKDVIIVDGMVDTGGYSVESSNCFQEQRC